MKTRIRISILCLALVGVVAGVGYRFLSWARKKEEERILEMQQVLRDVRMDLKRFGSDVADARAAALILSYYRQLDQYVDTPWRLSARPRSPHVPPELRGTSREAKHDELRRGREYYCQEIGITNAADARDAAYRAWQRYSSLSTQASAKRFAEVFRLFIKDPIPGSVTNVGGYLWGPSPVRKHGWALHFNTAPEDCDRLFDLSAFDPPSVKINGNFAGERVPLMEELDANQHLDKRKLFHRQVETARGDLLDICVSQDKTRLMVGIQSDTELTARR